METPETLPDGRQGLPGLEGFMGEVPAEGPVQFVDLGPRDIVVQRGNCCVIFIRPLQTGISM